MTTEADVAAVTAANAELYAAFEDGDLDRLEAVWDESDEVRCVHPGWPLLQGRSRVLRSWSVIMANTSYIQFFLTGIDAIVEGDIAIVTCEENILTAVVEADGTLSDGAKVMATNVFRRRPAGWKLIVHHGSPVLAARDEDGPG